MSGQSCGNSTAGTKSSRRFRRRGLLPACGKWRHFLPVCRTAICHSLLSRNAAKAVFFIHEGCPASPAGRPFCVHRPFCFFLRQHRTNELCGIECFFRQLQAADGGNAPGPYARRAGLPCRAAWMKPWDGAGHQVLSPLKSRVRSFTQRYLR